MVLYVLTGDTLGSGEDEADSWQQGGTVLLGMGSEDEQAQSHTDQL